MVVGGLIGSVTPGSNLDIQGTLNVRILGGGNVGIATVNPGAALDVQGSVRIWPERAVSGEATLCIDTLGRIVKGSAALCTGS